MGQFLTTSCQAEQDGQVVSVKRAQAFSSNAAATAARYHTVSALQKVTNDYEVTEEVLGNGMCGDVVLVRGRVDGRRYAQKTIQKPMMSEAKLKSLVLEVEIYLTLDHPNIARLHDVYESQEAITLIEECCEGGELYYCLQKRGVYTDAHAAETARQMLRAVSYLHSHNIVHRDLKLENFLYESEAQDAQLKLIDFGFAKIWDPSTLMMASCGSITYVSPDVLDGKGYTSKCDLWSLGVVVWMLLVGYPPFHGKEKEMIKKIRSGKADWGHKARWKPVTAEAQDFVGKLLVKDPYLRMDAQVALKHPWLLQTGTRSSVPLLSRDALRSMHRFSTASKVRRALLLLIARELGREETEELREMFLAIDSTHEGTIRLHELKDAIRSGRSPKRDVCGDLECSSPASGISAS